MQAIAINKATGKLHCKGPRHELRAIENAHIEQVTKNDYYVVADNPEKHSLLIETEHVAPRSAASIKLYVINWFSGTVYSSNLTGSTWFFEPVIEENNGNRLFAKGLTNNVAQRTMRLCERGVDMKLVMFSVNQSSSKRGHTVVVDDVRAVVPLASGVTANLAADSLYYVASDGSTPLSALVVPNIGEPALLSINPLGVPVFTKPAIGPGYDLASRIGLSVIGGRNYNLEFELSANDHKVIPIGGSDAKKTDVGFVLSAPPGERRAGCLVVSSEGVLQINAEWINTIVIEVNQLYNNEGGVQHANN